MRASDTDILVILIGAIEQATWTGRSMANIIMDCGMRNSRRYINVTHIAATLERCKPDLPEHCLDITPSLDATLHQLFPSRREINIIN